MSAESVTALAQAIERKARELGVWMSVAPPESEWGVGFAIGAGKTIVWRFRPGEDGATRMLLDPLAAAAWLLMWGLTIDVGPCKVCDGRGYPLRQFMTIDTRTGRNGWDCHACAATGRETRELPRAMLDCEPTMVPPCCSGEFIECMCEGRAQEDWGGVQESREAVAVEADRLQAAGEQRGAVLALWLAGELSGEHVLGVERCHRQHIAEGWGKRPEAEGAAELHDWAESEGWETLDGWSFHRPTLEARP